MKKRSASDILPGIEVCMRTLEFGLWVSILGTSSVNPNDDLLRVAQFIKTHGAYLDDSLKPNAIFAIMNHVKFVESIGGKIQYEHCNNPYIKYSEVMLFIAQNCVPPTFFDEPTYTSALFEFFKVLMETNSTVGQELLVKLRTYLPFQMPRSVILALVNNHMALSISRRWAFLQSVTECERTKSGARILVETVISRSVRFLFGADIVIILIELCGDDFDLDCFLTKPHDDPACKNSELGWLSMDRNTTNEFLIALRKRFESTRIDRQAAVLTFFEGKMPASIVQIINAYNDRPTELHSCIAPLRIN